MVYLMMSGWPIAARTLRMVLTVESVSSCLDVVSLTVAGCFRDFLTLVACTLVAWSKKMTGIRSEFNYIYKMIFSSISSECVINCNWHMHKVTIASKYCMKIILSKLFTNLSYTYLFLSFYLSAIVHIKHNTTKKVYCILIKLSNVKIKLLKVMWQKTRLAIIEGAKDWMGKKPRGPDLIS